MAAGVADRLWEVADMVGVLATSEASSSLFLAFVVYQSLLNFRSIDTFPALMGAGIAIDRHQAPVGEMRRLSQALRQFWKQPISALLGESVQG
jgi:hypothetical protein